jgi:hypothetical protein
MSKHDNIYNILGKLENLQPKVESVKQETKPIYESVEPRGSVLAGVARVEATLAEKYMGFKKLKEVGDKLPAPPDEVHLPKKGSKHGPVDVYRPKKEVEESGLQAYLGKKKYGEKGMAALQQAGREGASKEKMALLRAKHDKLDEEPNEDMLSPKQKKIARMGGDPNKIDAKDFAALRGQKKGQKDEGNLFTGNLVKARAQGKKEADLDGDGDMEKVHEGFDDMEKYLKAKQGPQPKGGSGKVAGKRYGGAAQKDDEGDEEVSDQPKKKGRPKKDKFAEEQVNELSPDTLSSYADKARGQRNWAAGRAISAKQGHTYADPQGKFDRLWDKRAAGYAKAVAKGATDIDKTQGLQSRGGPASSWNWSKDDTPAALKRDKGMSEMQEVAPPGAKAERMVKHIKKGYAKDGKITPKEKSIAFATAWKAHNKGKLKEGVNFTEMMREAHANLEELLMELQQDISEFKRTGNMSEKLRDALEMHRFSKRPIIDEVVKPAPGEDLRKVDFVSPEEKLAPHAGMGRGPISKALGQAGTMAKNVGRFVLGRPEIPTMEDQELNELAKLAGLTEAKKCNHTNEGKECPVHGLKECGKMYESAKPDYLDFDKDGDKDEPMKKALKDKEKVDECGDMSPMSNMGSDNDGMSVNSSFDTNTGEKSISVTAKGDAAEQLAQMLKMAGLAGKSQEKPAAVVISTDSDERVEEERTEQYANTPDEEVENVDAIMHQGTDLNREKEQYADKPKAGDNPMATRESIEMPKSVSKILQGIKKSENV